MMNAKVEFNFVAVSTRARLESVLSKEMVATTLSSSSNKQMQLKKS